MTPEDWIAAVRKESRGMSRPVYRGQEDAKWPLHSNAVRRLRKARGEEVLKDECKLKELLDIYHRTQLIEPMDTIVGDTMLGLRRLAALQHHGAATGLLDFTESPLVALWFACKGQPDADGIVFMFDLGDHNVALKARAEDYQFDRESRVLYYEPDRSLGTRIVAQQSVQLFCNPVIPETRFVTVPVPKEIKNSMQNHLSKLGVLNEKLFADIPGLAAANTVEAPLPISTPKELRRRGGRNYQQGRLPEAIEDYNEYVKLCPDIAESHALLGDARAASGQYDEAVKEYTTAIGNIGQPIPPEKNVTLAASVGERMLHRIHYNRGNARAANREHSEAIADFEDALKHGDDLARDVLYNRGNSKFALGSFDEAWFDFDAAGKHREGSDACLAMGNCKVWLGEFEEARHAYTRGLQMSADTSAGHCKENAARVGGILQTLGGRSFSLGRNDSNLTVNSQGVSGPSPFPFAGNRGNVGNTPSAMESLQGGEGYGGLRGFAVEVRSSA